MDKNLSVNVFTCEYDGLRALFRARLSEWKKETFGAQAETEHSSTPSTSLQTTFVNISKSKVLNKDLVLLLQETSKGNSIIEHYRKNKKLTDFHRYGLIDIIIEEVIFSQTVLKDWQFNQLFQEICESFPCESQLKDFYYIPRKNRNNAAGRLFSRYKSKCYKKRKLQASSSPSRPCFPNLDSLIEVDPIICIAYKAALNRDGDDWAGVIDKWRKTYHSRQKDLKTKGSLEFLTEWSKFAHPKADELIKIDFDILYPSKGNLLFAKWSFFKKHIEAHYKKITNAYCKNLFLSGSSTENIDAQDYIYAILLVAILPSTTRFPSESGKRTKKATILDAQESLVLCLPTLNDYQRQMEAVINKYYNAGQSLQPFIIVEGLTPDEIRGFYISFNKVLLKCGSIIECLDVCFKIFQVLGLQYPQACYNVWLFFQTFFYEITTEHDKKSVSLISLVNTFNDIQK
ncbi:uncharacterized protein [Drosophila suzukii]|uniref:Uncharacterized protein n=1 Tax=Drosophila suzukii TaxID=28584 RepID=A0ABM4TYL6_DROSZ